MFREDLPDKCPPAEAKSPEDGLIVYRLVAEAPPTHRDFDSVRRLQPNRVLDDECDARGVSVFTDPAEASSKRLLRPFRSHKVCPVRLCNQAGPILHNGSRSHHTWWPFANFDILGACGQVVP